MANPSKSPGEPRGRVLTLEETAVYLGVSHSTVYEYCRVYPDFPVVKLSQRTWRVPVDALDAWLARRIGQEPVAQVVTVSAAATMKLVRAGKAHLLKPEWVR